LSSRDKLMDAVTCTSYRYL